MTLRQIPVAARRRDAWAGWLRHGGVVGLAFAALVGGAAHRAAAQDVTPSPVAPGTAFVLPKTSDADLDRLLGALEHAYASMDAERWVSFFTDDVEQLDVPCRVHIVGKAAWRAQTERINGAHLRMGRVHHGRARVGDWVVVEVEWFGTIRGEAIGVPGEDRSYRYSGLALLELRGGKIRRQVIYGDVPTLKEQLRVPANGQATPTH